eukprot:g967.t1
MTSLTEKDTVVSCGLDAPTVRYAVKSEEGSRKSIASDSFSAAFKKDVSIRILRKSFESIEFDLVGCDAAIANTMRRVLLAEVPSVAICLVLIQENTSVMQDEVLAHRLGLLPIKFDHRRLLERKLSATAAAGNNSDTLCFELNVKCTKNKNGTVYSKALRWKPLSGQQSQMFATDPPRMVHDDIIVCKMRPGQSIRCEMLCWKGVGKDHAKFQPVAPASYRLLPTVRFKEPVRGKLAEELKERCPGIDIDENGEAIVTSARDITMCRESLRHPELQKRLEIGRKTSHYIFTIESVGALSAETLFLEAIQVFKYKCACILDSLQNVSEGT